MPKQSEHWNEQTESELAALRRRVAELEAQVQEQAESTKALEDHREFLNHVINQLPNAIFWKRRDLVFDGCNQAFADITGMDHPDDVIGKTDYELHRDPTYADSYRSRDLEIMDSDRPELNFEDSYHDPEGREGTVLTSKLPIHDSQGEVVGVLGICTDITERKRAEEESQQLAHELGERVKELSCLYAVAGLVEQKDSSLGGILQGIVDIVPTTWQHEDNVCARLVVGDLCFETKNFRETAWKLGQAIIIDGEWSGFIDVYYLSEQPEADEGPFLKEERMLLDVLAERIGRIVQRVRTEEALTQARKRYEDLVKNLNVGVYRNTPGIDGVFLEANPEMVAMFEAKSKEEFLGHRVADFYKNPEQRRAFSEKMMVDGFVHDEELELKTLTGRTFWASVTSVQKQDEDGLVYFDGVVEDITDRKLAEFQLQLQATALESAANGIVITDPEGRILWVNPAVETLTGYTADEVIGQDTRLLKSGVQSREFYQEMWETVKQGRVWRGEIVNRRKDGRHYTEDMTITPVVDAEGRIVNFIAIKQDISERKRAEKMEDAVFQIAEQSASADDLHTFCESIHSVLADLMYAKNFYIALLDEEKQEISFPYFADEKDEAAPTRKLDYGLTDYILRTGETLWLGRPGALDEVHARGFAAKGTKAIDWLGVPLKRGWQSFGVVAVQSYEEEVVYNERDAELLTFMSQQIASMLGRRGAEEALRQSAEALREKNLDMQEDLNMARDVQQALLPQYYPTLPESADPENSLLRFCHLYYPSGTVGGDFFDVQALSETRVGVFICDVMGHGIRAALVTAILRGISEELTLVARDPGMFLTLLNRDFGAIFRPMQQGMFATAFYLVADVATGEILYANAGHPSPMVLRRREGNVQSLVDEATSGPALGLLGDHEFETSTTRLDVGDAVVLYTDGIWEVEAPDGKAFGDERFLAVVQEHLARSTSELLGELLTEAELFAEGHGFSDDMCLVGIDVGARDEPPFWGDPGSQPSDPETP